MTTDTLAAALEREHGEIWDTIDMLQAQLRADPAGSTHAETCSELLAQLERHNTKEEAIIYPQVDAAVSPAADAGLTAFLRSERLPVGWVCAQSQSARS